MDRFARLVLVLLVASPLLTCGSASDPEVATASVPGAVVYGTDDRLDVYAVTEAAWRNRALLSTVALVDKSRVNQADPNNVVLTGSTLQQSQVLCPGESFATQKTAAYCSGTLIDDDLVLTAGHCITNRKGCQSTAFVFRYAMDSASQATTITSADVFTCAAIVARVQTSTVDYGVIRLDRKATPRFTPAAVRPGRAAVGLADPLVVIGVPSGLPFKVADGAFVRDPRASTLDYFVGNPDTFGGNSGSGVYDAFTGLLEGILVRGETDYVYDAVGRCYQVNVCSMDGCGGEDSTYAFRAVDAVCATAPTTRLCPPVCGDGTCSDGETTATCPADCPYAPPGWTCSAATYDAGDGCHCKCGVYDPDCDVTPLPAINCKKGFVCSAAGTCVR
jgi:hypothetical protein